MLAEQPAGHVTTPIMPARPLCMLEDTTACPVVRELRERVEALEWMVEVEDAKDAIYWSHDSSDDSWDEYIEIHSCARRKAGFPPLEPKKITSDAMGLKEAWV